MSKFLNRFRSTDTARIVETFGDPGQITTLDGSRIEITGVERDPYSASAPGGFNMENEQPSVWFVTARLPVSELKGCIWTKFDGEPREILAREPNARTGMTRCTLSDL